MVVSKEGDGGGVLDLGGEWIQEGQRCVEELVGRYGLEVEGDKGRVSGVNALQKTRFPEALANLQDELDDLCAKIEARDHTTLTALDFMTLEEWLRRHEHHEEAGVPLRAAARFELGVEPSEVSALFFINYYKSGRTSTTVRGDRTKTTQRRRIASGASSLVHGLANELPPETVVLRSPVRRIEQKEDCVRVLSARGVYRASRVIVSVPTSLYHEIQFTPPLPDAKQKLSKSTRAGDICKVLLSYDRPWWRDVPIAYDYGSFIEVHDSGSQDSYSLTCVLGGQAARDWALLDPEIQEKAVLDEIRRIYASSVDVEKPISVAEQIWKHEQWSQGSSPVMGPGMLEYEHELRAPFDRIHFVGTETAQEWRLHMEGALRSGERGAEEVLAVL